MGYDSFILPRLPRMFGNSSQHRSPWLDPRPSYVASHVPGVPKHGSSPRPPPCYMWLEAMVSPPAARGGAIPP